jgi:hypothetical protein
MTTTTTHTQADLRDLTCEETLAASGGMMGLGIAIATSIALQTVKDNTGGSRPGASRTTAAVLNFVKG